ncbi:armadillo-type protein [Polychytrium aggregatum]|uniref:armadillo-type protein n=1 Tax=Polychytrium aggregatum TaxID=110093 RepID=UPI0022FE3343|nr:armadillo-type protein [Polychytrium aggregatum]KAI9197525.1 armadillo-type protein [Polychytrium aggregatum]
MLQKDSERASIFFKIAEQANDSNLPYAPFVKLLKKDDEYLQLKAAKIATFLLLEQTTPVKYDPSELFAWTINQMSAPNQNVVDIAVQLVQSLLSIVNYRPLFFQTQRGVSSLVDILKRGNPSAQMQYQVIYNFWLLSFDEDVAAEIQRKHDIVPVMIDIAKSAIKEKVVRVVISTFVNLLVKAPEENLMAMLAHKVLNLSETLSSRKWSDTEIADDLEFIKEKLQTNVANLSTFDEYSAEVRSGALSWSPPHISEQFWKQNASRLNDKDFELLRMLSRLLATSANPVVLAVAAHDIGQYVKYATNGKRHVQEIGAKTQIMELMAHENQDVRYQALLAVQKYMAHAWEY